ncbi:hypothetical protein R1flu_011605 [Riccia fluitans]|uniref:Uncharacterized protein n=1 Tax=Riccia fluitans TaxID=41844 RepID=A0ABD1Z8I1_9MARC
MEHDNWNCLFHNTIILVSISEVATSALSGVAAVTLNTAGCSSVAGGVTAGSLFLHIMSHALQIGAVFEVYRNCAGYYNDVAKSIDEVLRLPVAKREDGAIFSHKIALLLGRKPSVTPMIPAKEKEVGTLFCVVHNSEQS